MAADVCYRWILMPVAVNADNSNIWYFVQDMTMFLFFYFLNYLAVKIILQQVFDESMDVMLKGMVMDLVNGDGY